MKRRILLISFALSSFALFFGGCHDKEVYKNDNGGLTTDDVFDFSTRQNVDLSLNYSVPEGYRVYFEVFKENPLTADEYGNLLRNDAQPIATGHTKDNGECKVPLSIASYVETLYIYSPNIGAPRLLQGDIVNGKVEISNKNTAQALNRGVLSRANEKPYYSNWKRQTLSWLEDASHVTYDASGKLTTPTEKIEITAQQLYNINATIPEGEQLNMSFSNQNEITLSEEAEVRMYYVSNTQERENALAYYTFTDDEMKGLTLDQKRAYINSRLILLFPRLSEKVLNLGEGVQLKYWDGTQLQTSFPAGAKIGFVLVVKGWNTDQVATTSEVMYSDKSLNRYNIGNSQMSDRPQMACFKTSDDYFILSFEDQPWTESSDYPQYRGDFRNNVFVLHSNPPEALPDVDKGEDVIDKPIPGMAMNAKGTLAFEDNWPYKGDYDLNDVVVTYDLNDYFDLDEAYYNGFEGEIVFVNNGAQYKNGFGIQLPSDRTNIKSCAIESDYKYAGQGLDADLDQATIMLFDDGTKVPAGTKFKVKVQYQTGPDFTSKYAKILRAPYNPFVTVDDNGGKRKEVHLVNYLPTAKADEALLHYGHDLSNPTEGVYYVSDAKFPFAIDIADALDYKLPGESVRIDKMYPRFTNWVESDGKTDKDWYK